MEEFMKIHAFALTLGFGLLSISGVATACQPQYRTNRSNIGIEPFINAVKGGDLQLFDRYVKLRRITNFERIIDAQHGMNALHWAAVLGHVHIMRYLIMHGADVNAITPKGFTALHLATFANQNDAVKCLVLEGNCNALKATSTGLTALDLARSKNNRNLETFLARFQRSRTDRFAMKLPRNLLHLAQ